MAKILPADKGESTERANTLAEEQIARTYTRDAQRTHERSAAQARADEADRHAREQAGRGDTSADFARGASPQAARPRGDKPKAP